MLLYSREYAVSSVPNLKTTVGIPYTNTIDFVGRYQISHNVYRKILRVAEGHAAALLPITWITSVLPMICSCICQSDLTRPDAKIRRDHLSSSSFRHGGANVGKDAAPKGSVAVLIASLHRLSAPSTSSASLGSFGTSTDSPSRPDVTMRKGRPVETGSTGLCPTMK